MSRSNSARITGAGADLQAARTEALDHFGHPRNYIRIFGDLLRLQRNEPLVESLHGGLASPDAIFSSPRIRNARLEKDAADVILLGQPHLMARLRLRDGNASRVKDLP
jgi:hypothetical protein